MRTTGLSSLSVLKKKLGHVPEVLMTLKLTLVILRANPEVLFRPIVSCLKDDSGAGWYYQALLQPFSGYLQNGMCAGFKTN